MEKLLLALLLIFPLMAVAQENDPLKGKRIGVVGDSYVGNHHDPREYTLLSRRRGERFSAITLSTQTNDVVISELF